MDGLKAIAQSTFDKLQQFRPSGNPGGGSHSHSNNNTNNPGGPNHTGANPGDGDSGPYRYNVVEIGAFGPAPSSLVSNPGLRRQQSSSTPNLATNGGTSRQSVGGGGGSTPASAGGAASSSTTVRRVTMNEWMVFEDDLAAFMKKRPVDYVTVATEPQENTTSNTAKKGSSKSQASTRKEEVEAFASLKLVCIQRIDPHDDNQDEEEEEDDDDDVEEEYYLDDGEDNVEDDYRRHLKDYQRQNQPPRLQPETNTLAISRDTFLRLYVTLMDGDHSALYYLAREYDGFHEFNDANKGITTKYVGTADYALLWTFNRRTLETRGLFIDRCQRWQAKDSFPLLTAALSGGPEPSRLSTLSSDGLILSRSAVQRTSSTAAQHPGSPPVTPVTPNNTHRSTSRQLYTHLEHNHNQSHASRLHDASSVHSTPSRRWTKNRTGSVTASEAWRGFRETLSIYRSYVFVPQLLSFVSVVHMLRAFDDQLNDEDLPLIKSVEATLVGNVQRNSRVGVPGGGKHRRGMRQSSRSVAGFDPASSSFYAGSPSASRYGRGGTGGEDGRHGNANLHAASSRINSIMMPSQTTNFSLVSEPNNNQTKNAFAPSTPPAEAADKSEQQPQATSGPSRPGTATGPPAGQTPQQAAQAAQIAQAQAHAAAQATAQAQAAAITALAARDKLLAQAVLLSRVDTSLANKRRHLDLARKLLEVLTQEHETLFVDVVAPLYLDRYHRAMEGLAEAVPALERHVASLDDFLCYLKGRAETLSGLVRTSSDCNCCCCFANLPPLLPFDLSRDHHQQLSSILQHPAFPTPVPLHPPLGRRRKRKKSPKAKPSHHDHHSPEPPSSPSLSLSRTISDAWSLRCNEADSRSSDLDLGRHHGHSRPPYAAPATAGEVFTTAGGRTTSPIGYGGGGSGFGSSAIRGWSRGRQPFTSAAASLAAIVAGDTAAVVGTTQTGTGGPAIGGRRTQSTSGGQQQPQSYDQQGQGQEPGQQQQQQQQDTDQRPQSARQRRGSSIGFYAGYLFRGNHSHRVTQ